MPRRTSSSSPKSSSSSKGRTSNAKQSKPATRSAKNAQAPAHHERLIDDHARRDIVGIVFIVLAIVLFITAILPSSAVVTGFVSHYLRLGIGIGVFVLPIFLAAVGVSVIVRPENERVPARVVVGLSIVFFAILVLLALFTPGAENGASQVIFDQHMLTIRGGYVGAGVAYAGLNLFGQVISVIIMVGVTIAGLAIIGVSLSRFVERVKRIRAERAEHPELHSARFFKNRKAQPDGQSQNAADAAQGSSDQPETKVLAKRSRNAKDADPGEQPQLHDARKGRATAAPANEAGTGAQAPSADARKRGGRFAFDAPDADMPAMPAFLQDADAAQDQAVTHVLPRRTRNLDPIVGTAEADPALTRKLGASADGASTGKHAKADASDAAQQKGSAKQQARKRSSKKGDPIAQPHPQEGFELPPMEYLEVSRSQKRGKASANDLQSTASALQQTLQDFNINAEVVGWIAGPTVTLFKVDLPAGVRVSRVTALNDDIALALATTGVRIFAPIPGTNFVGIEVPNRQRQNVLLGDVLPDAKPGPLQIAIGKDVEGNSIISDLSKMPHLLIGGTTGSGKSVSINAMIMSILMRATPAEVRFILIDPKRVEFTPYNGIPHLYVPVVTEAKEAASALSWGVAEMERRLKVFSKAGARNIGQYNAKVQSGALEDEDAAELPYIVIVIDELADLMMNVGKEVEFSISRIAQLARAAGIHLIVATQRPSANVVTGLIKANITNRIAFNVASGIDSRVILDTPGAENLIGLGDLLLSKPELAKPQRIQGCFVSEDEINAVVDFLKDQGEPEYHSEILKTNLITLGASQPDGSGGSASDDDPLLWEAAEIVVSAKFGSTSNIQRRLKVGYSRAGRIMDMLEEKGIVGPANGSKPREVLVDELELESLKAFELGDASDM